MRVSPEYITLLFLVFCGTAHAQLDLAPDNDTTAPFTSSVFTETISLSSDYISDSITDRYPSKDDKRMVKKGSKLITAEPDSKNYKQYYDVAKSCWELRRIAEAEKMFLKIFHSQAPFYNTNFVNGGPTVYDSSTNLGYGNYVSHFKHYACYYLSLIEIEKGNVDQGLNYIRLADQVYPLTFTCGTGYRFYWNRIKEVYGYCFRELKMHDSIVALYLHYYYDCAYLLIDAIKAKYSPAQIRDSLLAAEASIVFYQDTVGYEELAPIDANGETQTTGTISYVHSSARFRLFGYEMDMPALALNCEGAEREYYLNEFRETLFYKRLKGED